MNILASRNNCTANMVKHKIFEQLNNLGVTIEMIKRENLIYNNIKIVQGDLYNMHYDDTPAALFIEMTEEYIEMLKSVISEDQIHREIIKNDCIESNQDEDYLPF